MKYVDDMTAAEAINLKKQLVKNPNSNPARPLQYHERTEHILPEGQSQVQDLLDQLVSYSADHQMKINSEKTKVILFNNARNYDFLPKCTIGDDNELEVVEEIKLLGVMVTSDLKWNAHCDLICQKAFSRLWMIRRLKPLGATVDELLEIYITQIKSIL